MYDEYLRRNLIVASAYGAKSGVSRSLKRLEMMQRVPKWLLTSLRGVLERQDELPIELAKWRDAAHDAPKTSAEARAAQMLWCANYLEQNGFAWKPKNRVE